MLVYNTSFVLQQPQRAVTPRDDLQILDHIEIPWTPLGTSYELSSAELQEYNGEHTAGHLLSADLYTDIDFNPNTQMHPSHAHGQPRTRGSKNVVWHCCDCGDGPYSIWQNVCINCTHKRCNFCQKEETS
jgi:hypothetical protein